MKWRGRSKQTNFLNCANEQEWKWTCEVGKLQLAYSSQTALTEQTLSSWGVTVSGMCVFRVGVKISLVSQAKWMCCVQVYS